MAAAALPSTGGEAAPVPTCDTRDMLMIHTVLRALLADAIRLVRGVPDGDRARARIVGDHVLEVANGLHSHHQGEDELLWGRLQERAPSCAVHVAQMREQHAEVATLLDTAEGAVPPWVATGSAADRDRVADAVQTVLTTLERHLGAEESVILPVVATSLSPKEWGALAEHGRASTPKGRMWFQLGLMLANAGPYRELLWGELPPPVKLLYGLVGERRYRRERALLDGV
jgi:iron-sulfur cluster repair protein YtfE (RIC family)